MTSQSKLAADKDPQVGWWWDGGHSEFSMPPHLKSKPKI